MLVDDPAGTLLPIRGVHQARRVTNAFALLRLLPMSDRDKDEEIRALRHQTTILERQPSAALP
ncbi:hypothetical protein GCM10009634_49370 [Saccharothrix xinjiangensis]